MSPKDQQQRWNLLKYILMAVAVVFVLRYFFFAQPAAEQATYSEFLQALEGNNVAQAQISESEIEWRVRADEEWVTSTRIPGVDDADLVSQLREHGVDFSGEAGSLWSTMLGWLIPIGVFAVIWILVISRTGGRQHFFAFGRSGARVYDRGAVEVNFDSAAGVDEAKTELQEVVDILRNPARYQTLGGKLPKGILITGPPGTGKTLLALATAGEASVPFYSMSGSEFVQMFVGVGASRVRDLFDQAKRNAPCLVFIDEIDAIGKVRSGATAVGGHEEREQTLNQLLTEMDGFDPSGGVIIMAATNRPDILDPALLRPGRFDRQIVLDRPDMRGREAILRVHVRNVKLSPDVDLHTLAARTPGFAGAELANVVNEAALLAARHGEDAVGTTDFDEAIDRVMSRIERKSPIISGEEREVVAHHEMGHAMVALLIPGADPVQKVSIIPRGPAALGMTLQVPLQDKYLFTREELEDKIAVMMGGRVAEELSFQRISIGAQDDISRATDLARRMVRDFGMSERLGPLSFGEPMGSVLAFSRRSGSRVQRGHGKDYRRGSKGDRRPESRAGAGPASEQYRHSADSRQ